MEQEEIAPWVRHGHQEIETEETITTETPDHVTTPDTPKKNTDVNRAFHLKRNSEFPLLESKNI